RSWRGNRGLTLALLYVLVAWPLVHAPFYWLNGRYMMPANLFAYYFAGLGAAEAWRWAVSQKQTLGVATRCGLLLAFFSLGAFFAVPSALFLRDWPALAAK